MTEQLNQEQVEKQKRKPGSRLPEWMRLIKEQLSLEQVKKPEKRKPKELGSWFYEWLVGGFIIGSEMVRWSFVNEDGRRDAAEKLQQLYGEKIKSGPFWNPRSSDMFPLLQRFGNFMEGYMISFLGYHLFSLGPGKKVPETVRVAAAFLLGSGIVAAAETGLLKVVDSTSDLGDIPAGVLGSVVYVGTHYLANRLVKYLNEDISEIEHSIKSIK